MGSKSQSQGEKIMAEQFSILKFENTFPVEDQDNLLNAIISDNVTTFASLYDAYDISSISFGRFPILSLCYLYGSNKILSKYQECLLQIEEYVLLPEPHILSIKLRTFSKKALRLYQDKNAIISPLEMAAILNDYVVFKSIFNKCHKSQDILTRIDKIYLVEERVIVNSSTAAIKLPKKRMRSIEKLICIILIAIILVVMGGTGAVAYYSFYLSRGTEENPIFTNSAEQFLECIDGNYNFISITSDIVISNDTSFSSYSGAINGNGNTIYVSKNDSSFFDELSGTISNVVFVFENLGSTPFIQNFTGTMTNVSFVSTTSDCTIEDDFSPFIAYNYGTLNNITADITMDITSYGEKLPTGYNDNLFIGGVVANNYGTINGCVATINITAHGTSEINTYFGGIVGYNEGTITTASTTLGSSIQADTLDPAGIVGLNYYYATVTDSKNYATVTQTSISNYWTPNVGGIAVTNYGYLTSCYNYGDLSATGDMATASNTPNIYIGGISAANYGAISLCKNDATLAATASSSYIYLGGIIGRSESSSSSVENCASFGSYSIVSTSDDAYSFVGGTAGYNKGYIYSSFNCATLSAEGTNVYSGAIVGVSDYDTYSSTNSFFLFTAYYYNNKYIINEDSEEIGIGILLYNNYQLVTIEDDGSGLDAYESLDELKQSEVYWE